MANSNPTLEHILAALSDAKTVIDIGCGTGSLSGALAKRGFAVTGVDPQRSMIETAQVKYPNAEFIVACAEALPMRDQCYDAAIFLNSLHHITEKMMLQALTGAMAALRTGGILIVIEPLAAGDFFEAMRPLEDETIIRAAAIDALGEFRNSGVCHLLEYTTFDRANCFDDLAVFLAYLQTAAPERADLISVRYDAVAEAFCAHAKCDGAKYELTQPMAIWVFQSVNSQLDQTS